MEIFIDADACPVIRIAVRIAIEYGIMCTLICDTSHENEIEGAKTIYVSKGNDNADFAIVNKIKKGDIVITQDYGLASMCLGKRAYVLNQNGLEYTDKNIEYLMETRHEAKKLRSKGVHLKGPSKRTKENDISFESSLRKLICYLNNIQ